MQISNPNNKLNLVIYKKYIELIYYTNDILKKYPKFEHYALIKKIKTTLYSGLQLLMYAIKTYNEQEQLKYLNKINININKLKVHIKLSYKYKLITMQDYEDWNSLMADFSSLVENDLKVAK